MTTLAFHPLADVLPLIEGADFQALTSDIKTNGLHYPITMLDDQILDGRNRYRACLEAGVAPRFEPFTGSDPETFVIAKNLYRRHLTAGQRAMALAKYATLSNGQHATGQPVACKTIPEIAAMARVNKETVSNARMIQARGTPEEIAAVVNGSAPLTTVYKVVRAREVKTKERVGGGNKIKLPEGRAVSEVVRDGIKLELEGGGLPAAIAHRISIGVQTYITTRDVLLLSERDDLSRKDAETVRQALQEIDATQRVSKARSAIKPIALRVWGPRGMRLRKSDERRAKQFDDAIEFLKHTCENAIDMVIPHITHSHAETAIRHLSAAEGSLRKLRERIREVQHG